MNTINNRVLIGLIAVFVIFSGFALFSIMIDDSDEKFMEQLALHQKIDETQIESIRMSKVVLNNSTYSHHDIELNDEQNHKIINIFNSISHESVYSVNTTNPTVVAGIVIRLKNNTGVRIQYDNKEIFVTRSEVKYAVEDSELKELFDSLL